MARRDSLTRSVACGDCGSGVRFGTLGSCPRCGGILSFVTPARGLEALRRRRSARRGRGLDRYRALLPVSGPVPTLGEGDTPLRPSRRLGRALGLRRLYFKYEGANPTGSFKARAGALAAALARESGARGLVTASSGNAGSALAAYASAAGIDCLILLEPGNPLEKLKAALDAGARVVPVEGVFARGPTALAGLLREVAERTGLYLAFVWAPVNPYILDGIKTVAYEVAAQLGQVPDVVVSPVGGGDMLTAQWRGYLDLERAGVTRSRPRMVAVQSREAAPLLKAFESGARRVWPLDSASSHLSGINVAFTGDHALAAVLDSGGLAVGVSDEEALAARERLAADEGLDVEPASAAPVAALSALLSRGAISPDETVVCLLSGSDRKSLPPQVRRPAPSPVVAPVPFDAAAVAEAAGL
jgi:threonine synthase